MSLEKYLEKIQTDMESIFPMDSPKDKKPLRKYYPEQDEMYSKRRLMIDFDGVLHEYDGWNDGVIEGKPIQGAREAIEELKKTFEIIIFTTRASIEQAEEKGDDAEKRKAGCLLLTWNIENLQNQLTGF